jgi:adenylate cyclase
MKLRFFPTFNSFKKRLPRIAIGVLLTVIFSLQASSYLSIPILDRLDGILYDSKVRLNAIPGVDPRIVVIDIDEKSLQEREMGGEGRWPWPRDRLALLVNRLFSDYDVALTGFDVIFSERDESSGIRTIDELAKKQLKDNASFQAQYASIKSSLNYDAQFAKSFQDRAIILGLSFLTPGDNSRKGALPHSDLTAQEIPITLVSALKRDGFTANLELLQTNAAGGGHVNPTVDPDGIIRKIPMLIQHGDRYYESLGLAVARNLLGSLPIKPVLAPGADVNTLGGLEFLDVGGAMLPVDQELASYIPYRGPYKSFEYISASDVLAKKTPKEKLEGKIVLLGTTAPGLLDLRATPVGNAYPGVEIHANLIAGLLDGTIKQAPLWTQAVNLLLIAILGLALALLLPFLSPLWGSIAAALTLGGVGLLNWYSYQGGYVLPAAALLASLLLVYLMNIAYGFFVESRGKRLITGLFGQYVPPELVDEMAQDPSSFSMEGESRDLTILFSDVRGFTTISESLDAKTLSEFINAFLTPFTKVIYKNRGTIDKYMGDCIMAFWGAPIKDVDHARHGLISAFEMLKAMELLNTEFISKGWPPIKVGIGLNSGRVSVGNMGSEIRLAYTVMGDAVNLASRLEGITKEYGAAIIIGDETRKQLPDLIAREVDKVRVKGKDVAVTIYEPLGFEGQVGERNLSALPLFEKALQSYREQRWDEAESQFTDLLNHFRDTGEVLYTLYLERIGQLRQESPGSHWDGAFTFTKK